MLLASFPRLIYYTCVCAAYMCFVFPRLFQSVRVNIFIFSCYTIRKSLVCIWINAWEIQIAARYVSIEFLRLEIFSVKNSKNIIVETNTLDATLLKYIYIQIKTKNFYFIVRSVLLYYYHCNFMLSLSLHAEAAYGNEISTLNIGNQYEVLFFIHA